MSRAGHLALLAIAQLQAKQRDAHREPPRAAPIVLAQRVDVNGRSYDRHADMDDPAVKQLVAEAQALGIGIVVGTVRDC